MTPLVNPFTQFDIKLGFLCNSDSAEQVGALKTWLLENLVTFAWKTDKNGNSLKKYKFVKDEYKKRTSYRLLSSEVCSELKVDPDRKYLGYNDNGVKEMVPIIQSISFNKLFKDSTRPDSDDEDAIQQTFDSKRFSLFEDDLVNHPKYSEIMPILESLRAQVLNFAKSKDERIQHSYFTVLFSCAGGKKQGLHVDEIREVNYKNSIHSIILALEPGTKLDMSDTINSSDEDRHTLHLLPSSFIMFHGQQSHGGSDYSVPNIRLHFYLSNNADALDVFKKGYRAALLPCEAFSVEDGTPLNCPVRFKDPRERGRHYREHHSDWWWQFQDLRKGWNEMCRREKLRGYVKKHRQQKKKDTSEKENKKESEVETVEERKKESVVETVEERKKERDDSDSNSSSDTKSGNDSESSSSDSSNDSDDSSADEKESDDSSADESTSSNDESE